MMTKFSEPYRVEKTTAGFAVMNFSGGHEALFGNRGEAEELARMMNEQIEMKILLCCQILNYSELNVELDHAL
jgi:hypothetical protein